MDGSRYLTEIIEEFMKLKRLGEAALAQADRKDWFTVIDPESNSLAVIAKHMAGNMRSRWTDFLHSDGEKPDRKRDSEFVIEEGEGAERVLEVWNAGWQVFLDALHALKPEDLDKTVTIRGQPHTVTQAIHRQLNHYAYHVGQIVLLARHFAASPWQSLSIPRGRSEEFLRSGQYKPRF